MEITFTKTNTYKYKLITHSYLVTRLCMVQNKSLIIGKQNRKLNIIINKVQGFSLSY